MNCQIVYLLWISIFPWLEGQKIPLWGFRSIRVSQDHLFVDGIVPYFFHSFWSTLILENPHFSWFRMFWHNSLLRSFCWPALIAREHWKPGAHSFSAKCATEVLQGRPRNLIPEQVALGTDLPGSMAIAQKASSKTFKLCNFWNYMELQ